MESDKINRRVFLKNTTIAAAALTLTGTKVLADKPPLPKNKLPRWKGFNLLDFFSPRPPRNPGGTNSTTEDDLKWMSDWGFCCSGRD
jgi:endoglucanase